MADTAQQSAASHARYVPGYHFILFGLLTAYFGVAVSRVIRSFSFEAVLMVAVAVMLFLVAWYERVFAVTAQDRVIRLEETLRLHRLAPDLAARAGEVTRGQWVALRFASDAEFPALVKKVLDEKITDKKAIKQLVRDWRPDHLRV